VPERPFSLDRRPLFALAGWTVLIWSTRIRNAANQDDLGTAGKVGAVTIAAGFTLAGLALALQTARRSDSLRRWVPVFAGATILYWLVRAVQIVGRDHAVGFKVVHSVLAAVSISLSAWVLARLRDADRSPARDTTPA
jgi:uncharacterized membrane protein